MTETRGKKMVQGRSPKEIKMACKNGAERKAYGG